MVIDKKNKIFAKLLILMGIFQVISLRISFVRVFEYFFEVKYFAYFAGVGIILITIGLIILFREWITRKVMKILSVLLAVALIIQAYVIENLHYHLSLIFRIEAERGESSITITAVMITAIIFTLHAIVLLFAVLHLILSGKYDGKEAVLIILKDKEDK